MANRSREIWEPLLAIADAAEGHWPRTARQACAHFVREAEQQPVTTGVRLLADLRTIFTDCDTDRLVTVDVLANLVTLEEAPWGDINGGRPLDPRRLARELAQYHVAPVPFRNGCQITKGYVTYSTSGQLGLTDAWSRYLPTTDDNDAEGGVMEPLNRKSSKFAEEVVVRQRLLSVKQVAEILGTSERFPWRLTEERRIEFVHVRIAEKRAGRVHCGANGAGPCKEGWRPNST